MSSKTASINALAIARHNIALARQWAAELEYITFRDDIMRRYAVQYAFIMIGEALKDIDRSLLQKHGPEIPWRKIIGFRDWLAHSYDDLPDPRIITVLNQDLPQLDAVLATVLSYLETSPS